MRAYIGGTAMGDQADHASGITIVDLNGPTATTVGTTAPAAVDPMYLALSTDGAVLYAAHALADGQVSAWTVDGDELTPLGSARASGGDTPCHLSIHPGGRFLLTANYAGGTVAVHPIDDDGALGEASHVVRHTGHGPNTDRQDSPHTHMITTDPVDGPGRGHVLVIDLGNDTIYRYHLDEATGRLSEADQVQLPPGTGPRHLVVHGDYAYVAGELASTLSVIDLTTSPPTVISTTPTQQEAGPVPSYPSAVRLSPDARFCYLANRGPNTIATFTVDGPEVALTATVDAGGDYPWDMILHDQHMYVVHQHSSQLTTHHLDAVTGAPDQAAHSVDVAHPVCLLPTHDG